MIAHFIASSLTAWQKQTNCWIAARVDDLMQQLENGIHRLPPDFYRDLKAVFEAPELEGLVDSFEIECTEAYFGVDYVLSGTTMVQSIIGALHEMTKAEIDEALGITGELVQHDESTGD